MSYQSKYTGQEIDNKLDKIGEISVLDSIHCKLDVDYTPVAKTVVPFVKATGNMQINNGRFIIKPGQRVQINLALAFQGTSGAVNMNLHLKDFTNNIVIQEINTIHDSEQYEYPMANTAQYTNETEQNCEVGLFVNVIYRNDTMKRWTTSLTVHEIGRAMTIPNEGLAELPVATTDTLGGIKVGEGLEITEDGILSALAKGGSGYTETNLIDSALEYTLATSSTTIGTDVTLNDNIENYNQIVFVVDVYRKDIEGYSWHTNVSVLTNEIVYNTADSTGLAGDTIGLNVFWRTSTDGVHSICVTHFKNGTTLRIRNTVSNHSNATKFRIKAIKGIKY